MLSFFRPKPRQVRVEVIKRDPLRLSMDEFRSDPELLKKAQAALRDPTIRQMLDCIHLNHIGRWQFPRSMEGELRTRFADMAVGYTMAMNDFESLGVAIPVQQEVPITYG